MGRVEGGSRVTLIPGVTVSPGGGMTKFPTQPGVFLDFYGNPINLNTGVFNPKENGAKLDNVTDDTAAVQATINKASAAGGGMVIFPGMALIGTSTPIVIPNSAVAAYGLLIPSNVQLVGWGTPGSCGIRQGFAAIGLGTNCLLLNASNAVGNTDIKLINLDIICPAVAGASPSLTSFGLGVQFFGVTRCEIAGCRFQSAMIQAQPLSGKINTNTVNTQGLNHYWWVHHNSMENGAEAMAFYQGMGLTFTDNVCLNSYDSTVSINSSGEQIVVANNIMDKQGNTWLALAHIEFTNDGAGDSNGIRDVTVTGNVCLNSANTTGTKGVQFQGVAHGSATGNTIRNNSGAGLWANDGCVDIAFSGNNIDVPVTATSGQAYAIFISNDVACTDVTVIGNTIRFSAPNSNAVATGGGSQTIQRILIAVNQILANANNAIRNDAPVINGYVVDNQVGGSVGTINQGGGTGWVYRNNNGYNPVGSQVVAVPASGTAVAAAQIDRMFYVTAGASTCTMAIGGGGPSPVIPANGLASIRVPAGATVTPTYANAPTWVVEGE